MLILYRYLVHSVSDPDPGNTTQYGSGSRMPNQYGSARIRIRNTVYQVPTQIWHKKTNLLDTDLLFLEIEPCGIFKYNWIHASQFKRMKKMPYNILCPCTE